jgi:hypothetical protein
LTTKTPRLNTHFPQNPQQKHKNAHTKKIPQQIFFQVRLSCRKVTNPNKSMPQETSRFSRNRRLIDRKDLISPNIVQLLNNAARPMNFNRFHNTVRPKAEVRAFVAGR